MLNILKKLNAEKKNIWSFTSFVVETGATAYILYKAYSQNNETFRVVMAFAAAVLVVNIFAKLYSLIRK